MRKIFIILVLIIMGACSSDDGFIFSDNSTVRIKKSIEKIQTTLLDSEKGWIMSYFPNIDKYHYSNIKQNLYTDNLSYIRLRAQEGFGHGGYNFFIKFNKENNFIMQSDFDLNEGVISGEYNVSHNNGIELSFLTRNPIHNLVEKGFDGNTSFIIKKVEKDIIILSTIRNIGKDKEYIVLSKMPNSMDWQSHLDNIKKIKNEFEKMNFPVLEIINPEQKVVFRSNYYPKNQEQQQKPYFMNTHKRYVLFVENKEPNQYLSKFLVGVGSGYSFTDDELVFKNGFKLNKEVTFRVFKRENEKVFKSEINGYIAYIKER